VVIPVDQPSPTDTYAAAYARRVLPLDVRLVHFAGEGTQVDTLLRNWGHLGQRIDLLPRRSSIARDILGYVQDVHAEIGPDSLVNVIIPETVQHRGPRHLLHTFHVQRIKAALATEDGIVVTNIAHHPDYADLEPVIHPDGPGQVMQGWRHVALVLVAASNNASARSLRYARSLRADELRCVHVAVSEHEAQEVRDAWHTEHPGVPIEIVESPFRQIARPVHELVRGILSEQPRTFVTIVIPEFIVEKKWHRSLHNHTALTLKGTFLFEPSVVVSAVPYDL
jgi:hypothetical protein